MVIKTFQTGALQVNSYLVIDEDTNKAFLVDAGGYSDRLADEIKDVDLKYIVLTHGHGDHIGGVADYLARFPDTKLIVGKNEEDFLNDHENNGALQILGRKVVLEPDFYVKDGDEIEVGTMVLKIIETPGHTRGGISIYVGNAVFTGDTLFRASIGRTDLMGGDYETIKKSIKEKLFALPDNTEVYPGHMEPSTIGFEKEHNPFV